MVHVYDFRNFWRCGEILVIKNRGNKRVSGLLHLKSWCIEGILWVFVIRVCDTHQRILLGPFDFHHHECCAPRRRKRKAFCDFFSYQKSAPSNVQLPSAERKCPQVHLELLAIHSGLSGTQFFDYIKLRLCREVSYLLYEFLLKLRSKSRMHSWMTEGAQVRRNASQCYNTAACAIHLGRVPDLGNNSAQCTIRWYKT